MKLDFGLQVAGRIVDCAFTIAFDPKFDDLIKSTIDGTNAGTCQCPTYEGVG